MDDKILEKVKRIIEEAGLEVTVERWTQCAK